MRMGFYGRVNMRVETTPLWQRMKLSVVEDAQSLRDEWLVLGEHASDPYSCFSWCQAWYRASERHGTGKALIVVGRSAQGRVDMILPLFIEGSSGVRLVTRPARRISGDFGGIFRPELRDSIKDDQGKEFWARIAQVIPGDLLVLNGVSSEEIKRGNPLAHLYLHQSSIDGFHTTLEGDWDKQYEAMFSSKIRRNDRRCKRRMAEEGEVDCSVVAGAPAQTEAINALIEQKIEQLEEVGQPHHYADPTVRCFFELLPQLMQESADEEFLFVSMKFNGEVVATNFGVRKGERHYGLMTAMSAQMRKFSPGRLVMLETAGILTQRGCSFYDFGNGEYQYKQYWCTGKRNRFTAVQALSWKGRILAPLVKIYLRRKTQQELQRAEKQRAEGKKAPLAKKDGS